MYDKNHSVVKNYGLNFSSIDFSKHNLIVSGGREIKRMTYSRGEKLPYGKEVYKGTAIFKNRLYPYTIFVYQIDKINIHNDDLSAPELRIED